jgi:hypothetical protein
MRRALLRRLGCGLLLKLLLKLLLLLLPNLCKDDLSENGASSKPAQPRATCGGGSGVALCSQRLVEVFGRKSFACCLDRVCGYVAGHDFSLVLLHPQRFDAVGEFDLFDAAAQACLRAVRADLGKQVVVGSGLSAQPDVLECLL